MLRPPATPLVVHDPYFSVWSFHDTLTEGSSRHWTGANNGICGLIRIDDQCYRWASPYKKSTVPAMEQTNLAITPLKTTYTFAAGGVALTVDFLSPLLPDDLALLSRPVTYLTLGVRATDGQPHTVALYFDAGAEWTVDKHYQPIVGSRYRVGPLDVLSFGSKEQPVLEKVGDILKIDWGYFYIAAENAQTLLAHDRTARDGFLAGQMPVADDLRFPRNPYDKTPVGCVVFELGTVAEAVVSRDILLAYDDQFALEYHHRKTRAYWRRSGDGLRDAAALLLAAHGEGDSIKVRCQEHDTQILADLEAVGGAGFAQLCALAYRQGLAAHKLALDWDGTLLYFSKENYSNGCIDTVDVTYPSSPFFLLYNPALLKAQIGPILEYAESPAWTFPFAPHDLGTYPKANGQVYGGGEDSDEDQMPVEECGNLLILAAALAKAEGNVEFARRYWNTLTTWGVYLRERGLDPEKQLCTDDFAGHMAHNVNLSAKAILGLGAYAQLCEALGDVDTAQVVRQEAEAMAKAWEESAHDGDHYRLAFDREGTWSQKYNLVWDTLLGLNLFPAHVVETEIAYYKTKINAYGLPLDSRKDYTKLDWCVWTATLASSREDFDALVAPLVTWMEEGPTRVPLTDWYDTVSGKMSGFQARSVVAGLFIPLLAKKWGTLRW